MSLVFVIHLLAFIGTVQAVIHQPTSFLYDATIHLSCMGHVVFSLLWLSGNKIFAKIANESLVNALH